MVFWLGFYLFFFILSVAIGYHKGNLIAGVLLGYVLGPIGVALMCFSKDRKHTYCSSCHAQILQKDYFCPRCQARQARFSV